MGAFCTKRGGALLAPFAPKCTKSAPSFLRGSGRSVKNPGFGRPAAPGLVHFWRKSAPKVQEICKKFLSSEGHIHTEHPCIRGQGHFSLLKICFVECLFSWRNSCWHLAACSSYSDKSAVTETCFVGLPDFSS